MSIASITRLAAETAAQADDTAPQTRTSASRATTASQAQTPVQVAIEALAAYIPSEVLAFYLPALGILRPSSTGTWLVFGAGALMVVVLAWIGLSNRKEKVAQPKAIWVYIFGIVSFLLYAGALPGSPFETFSPEATRVFAVLALFAAALAPSFAKQVGIRPK